MNVYNFSKKIGKLLGKSSKVLKGEYRSLQEGYKEGLIIKCPICKEVVDRSDLNKIEFIKKNKMCNDCLLDKNSSHFDD